MEDIYLHIVDEEIFNKIKKGTCKFFVCLNDKNIQLYKEGNVLTFKAEDSSINVKILRLLYFASIKELANMVGKTNLGFQSGYNLDKLEDEYLTTYKSNAVDKFGFVAIEFEKVDS